MAAAKAPESKSETDQDQGQNQAQNENVMNSQLQNLLRSMDILPDGVLIIDGSQTIVGCNAVLETILGYPRKELVGRRLGILLPQEVAARHEHHVAKFLGEGGASAMGDRPYFNGVTKDGREVALSIGLSRWMSETDPYVIAVVRDASAVGAGLTDAMQDAETDPLTRLANRRFLVRRLEELKGCGAATRVGLLYADLDGFKPINDAHGHLVGDEVLKIVGKRLVGNLRAEDVCIRAGGDEFVIIVPSISGAEALRQVGMKIAGVLCKAVRVSEHSVHIGVSIGGVLAGGGVEPDEVLRRADAAMYEAKRSERPYAFGGEIINADVA